jgi:ABC-type glycerol-3-phosphate transport system substrate-binding protein
MAFQWLTAILLGARQPGPLASIAFGLLTPDTQAVRRAAKLRRNRLVGSRVAGVAAAVLSEKPNAAFAKLGRIGGGESLLCHRAHPLSVLLSGKPGAVHSRTNGYDFHMALARGEVSWTDERVRQTFVNWRELIDMGAFVDDHRTYSWQEALPFMINGEAAAYLMGNFAVAAFRDGGLTDDMLDFYQFPKIADVDYAEDAPTDTFHIASGAQNVEAAREFLRFVVSEENQTKINSGDALGQLPVNANAQIDDDKFLQEGFDMLSNNAGGGIMQFFDRDFPAEMASIGMEGLQEFMVFPDNLDDILQRLESARQRIYE